MNDKELKELNKVYEELGTVKNLAKSNNTKIKKVTIVTIGFNDLTSTNALIF